MNLALNKDKSETVRVCLEDHVLLPHSGSVSKCASVGAAPQGQTSVGARSHDNSKLTMIPQRAAVRQYH